MRVLFLLIAQLWLSCSAVAHELRPAYLDMHERTPNEFDVLWKVPALGDLRLGIYVRLPDTCVAKSAPARSILEGAYFERWVATCRDGLQGREIAIDGLNATLTDVLARIQYLDGSVEIARLSPDAPTFTARGTQSLWAVAWTYMLLGIEHILSGFDHLLFVLALVLLIDNRWMLLKTITAFTLAHSITLAGATLGYFSLPQKPVEASIALSIAFVASELVKMRPDQRRLSEAYPWLVAFCFGLLHGFGFAGALREIGLPYSDVPLALFTFNFGVEVGQLLFVAAILGSYKLITSVVAIQMMNARLMAGYFIGTAAMLWLVIRLASFELAL
jgi:hydrogenase/urease accessory protein HupE